LPELGLQIREAISAPDALLFVSVASLWATAIKVRLGRLDLRPSLSELPDLLDGLGMELLPIGVLHALAEAEPPPATRDPFDRMLLAQQLENMRLVTRDRELAAHPLAWRQD
jgi:PIN domain nuclease of toxin-antitoxin system